MKLSEEDSRARLEAHDHAILCTAHADRGIHAVPVCFAVDDGHVGVPIDSVKPKAATRLQRVRNLEADPRATLLVEQWDRHDWSKLWWVRAELNWVADPGAREPTLARLLSVRYPQYREQPFSQVLVLQITAVSGWAASPD